MSARATTHARRPVAWPLAAAAMLALQLGLIGAMILDRAAILRSDTVITLKPAPIDPRDLFRGDYVTLRYAISALPDDAPAPPAAPPAPVWVVATPSGDGDWRVRAVASERPTALAPGDAALRATLEYGGLVYGVERFYVPEGEGRALEQALGRQTTGDAQDDAGATAAIEVDIAVDGDGRAAIKALRRGGVLLYEEPWY